MAAEAPSGDSGHDTMSAPQSASYNKTTAPETYLPPIPFPAVFLWEERLVSQGDLG